ncbi:MAG: hypothetical protein ACOYT4_04865 [Nanoarchaeota archaeon]
MSFKKENFEDFILNHHVAGFSQEPFVLASGRKSYFYVNWRDICNDVFLTLQLINHIFEFTKDNNFEPDCYIGIAEGASKIGILCNFELGLRSANFCKGSHVIPMMRKESKKYGAAKDKNFIGEPRGKTIVLEDVTTTGHSLLKGINSLIKAKNEGANFDILAIIALTNRLEKTPIYEEESYFMFSQIYQSLTKREYVNPTSVEELIESIGIKYLNMSDTTTILSRAISREQIDKRIINKIQEEFGQYGTIKLELK